MPAAMNIQPAHRGDAPRLAAHAYRMGRPLRHVDAARTPSNRILAGPRIFAGAADLLAAIPTVQPTTGRKVRKDAIVAAAAIFTMPSELAGAPAAAREDWARRTVRWASREAPGKLLFAALHLDEATPHIHAQFAAVTPDGDVNYAQTWGGKKTVAAARMRRLQESYAAAIRECGGVRVLAGSSEGREYRHTGISGWRALKAETAGREAEAARRAAEAEALRERIEALGGVAEAARLRAEWAEWLLEIEAGKLLELKRRYAAGRAAGIEGFDAVDLEEDWIELIGPMRRAAETADFQTAEAEAGRIEETLDAWTRLAREALDAAPEPPAARKPRKSPGPGF